MTRWKVRVESDAGKVRLVLSDRGAVISVTHVTSHDYVEMCRAIASYVLETTEKVVLERMMARLWHDAQLKWDLSPELAKEKLLEFGWSKEVIQSYADDISMEIAKRFVEDLPEHGS